MDGIDFIGSINTLPIITSVSGSGTAIGEFDRVSFSISLTGRGDTGPEAKRDMAKPLSFLQDLLDSYQKEGINFVKNKTVAPFNLNRETRWDKNDNEIFSHYEAVYGLTFVVIGLDHTTRILDDLTEIVGLQASNPRFLMGNDQRIDLYRQALKNAVADARQSFALECELLGMSVDDYEVLKWRNSNSVSGHMGPQGSTGALGVTGPCSNRSTPERPRIIVNPGEAQISATINVSFTRTPKALMDYVARSAKACEESDLF